MVSQQISREITINAPIDRVWSLLTEAEGLGSWFPDNGATIDLKPGGAMSLSWREHGEVQAVVERVEPKRSFAFRWASQPDEPAAPGKSTLVEFTLTPEADGVRLVVVESGFSELAISTEAQAERVAGNTKGWASELDELRFLAEQPTA